MDPDLVRLILLVLGALLVAGIYLWDRYKRSSPRTPVGRRPPSAGALDCPMVDRDESARAEPSMGDAVESIPEMRVDEARARGGTGGGGVAARGAPEPDPEDVGDWSSVTADENPQFSMDLNFDAHQDGDYLNRDPALNDEVERKIVILNLVARGEAIAGKQIERACQSVGLVAGDMSIYHYPEPASGRALFSMASMVEPGSFPLTDMAGFSTPGLCLFTQLPGVRDGLEIYDQMLSTAQRLAEQLDAELLDDQRNPLTRQMQEHTRESIIGHRHRIQLERGRH
jgi:cell division protein ZipA